MRPHNTDALQSFSGVDLAGCLSSFLVDDSKAAHAMTNILHVLIPLFRSLYFFFLASF